MSQNDGRPIEEGQHSGSCSCFGGYGTLSMWAELPTFRRKFLPPLSLFKQVEMRNIFADFYFGPRDLKQLLRIGPNRKLKFVMCLKLLIFKPQKLSTCGNHLDGQMQIFVFVHAINYGLQKNHFLLETSW